MASNHELAASAGFQAKLAAGAGTLYTAFTMQSERLAALQRGSSFIVKRNPSLRSPHEKIERGTARSEWPVNHQLSTRLVACPVKERSVRAGSVAVKPT